MCFCVLLCFTACMLYYCNTVGRAWWDWGLIWCLTTLLQCFDTVGWVTWPVKISSSNDHTVSSGTLNPTQLKLFVLTQYRHVTDRWTETLHLTQCAVLRSAVIKVICSDKEDRSTSSSAYNHITVSMLWQRQRHHNAVLIFNANLQQEMLTPSTPAVPNCWCFECSAPYWSNMPFSISDIQALWRSGLSARVPECQKLKMVG